MDIYDLDRVLPLLDSEYYLFKLIANESGVVFLLRTTEHRDATRPGIRYADNYAGNALAAMVKPGVIEFRYHQDYTDDRVQDLAACMLAQSDLSFAVGFKVTYQNRVLIEASE
jgi:hypothetical protein